MVNEGDAAEPSVRFRVLGPVEILIRDKPVPLRAGRQQTVLSMLLLEANHVVGTDRLIDAVWGDDPPTTAGSQIQICVSALRRILAEAGGIIETRAPGYLIRLSPDQLDMQVFQDTVTEAGRVSRAGEVAEAAALLRDALALWSGNALASVTSRLVRAKAARLDQTRLSVYEECLDRELQLGRHRELVTELMTLVSQNPLRERLCGQLMLSLYRSGRQAEALEVYRTARTELVDQLGIEPGEELRRLERAILAQEAALDWTGTAEPAAHTAGPRQLTAATADFTGRMEQVDALERALTQSGTAANPCGVVPLVVIAGKTGVGKTALAIHVAHRLAATHFPDTQLYADLRGTRSDPLSSEELLMSFLRALSPPGTKFPDTPEERAQLYRSRLAARKALIVLDDVADEAQVRMLLPGSAGCAVIITSRVRLTGFPGSRLINLGQFDHGEAIELLGRVVGEDRVNAEPAAARTLSELVGGLPLALRVAGARLAARPHWTLETMVRRLADEHRRLDELVHGDLAVRASISLTYGGLPPQVRLLFRELSDLPWDTFPSWVAAAVLDIGVREAEDLLDELVDAHLLDYVAADSRGSISYRFHVLIRIFAREQTGEEPRREDEGRRRLLERVCGGWLFLAEHAHGLLYGGQFTLLHGSAPRWEPRGGFHETPLADPLAWLESERLNLTAAVRHSAGAGLDELCWDLASTLVTLFEARGYFDDWTDTHKFALDAVREAGNRRGTAAILSSLGSLHVTRRQTATAPELLDGAMEIFEELDDHHGRALVLRSQASLDYHMGETRLSLARYDAALRELREAGDLIGVAHVLVNIAQHQLDAGAPDEAVKQLDEALGICRSVGSRRTEAQVLYRLGLAHLEQDRVDAAGEALGSVLLLVRRNDDPVGESYARLGMSAVHRRLGNLKTAEAMLLRTLEISEDLADTVAQGRALFELGTLLAEGADPARARVHLERARAIFRDQRLRLWENRTLDALDALDGPAG
ncbi:BTAD domain-containing putative transcriptional regulator [Streptomyces castrisilvae]|uniref:BTAD domain-containing putative transcriptional regulator n=1 Tax=Streptomyces castrisilvae TaxID=3033811 RepID=A0ABY9HCS2_9ACTN|nr:BTAD domain-containing putative transcriptional regulator [Streptomyces sp. Mut1]WLQ32275.1 BTAD domain-containing putative transcriptional regulator [Streptomyces sp. Mut1]